MIRGAYLYLKDKQFYSKKKRYLELLGSFTFVEKLKEKYSLLHIIDMDLMKGSVKNFDIYERLTTDMYVEVEIPEKALRHAARLQEIDVRVVLAYPYRGKETLNLDFLEARVDTLDELSHVEPIRDVFTSNNNVAEEAFKMGFRLFFKGRHKNAFAVIEEV